MKEGLKEKDTRKKLEAIYLTAFRINMLLSDSERVDGFVTIINEDDFTMQLAEEFIERDLLKSYESEHLYQRLTAW